jgi:hypothetical protein
LVQDALFVKGEDDKEEEDEEEEEEDDDDDDDDDYDETCLRALHSSMPRAVWGSDGVASYVCVFRSGIRNYNYQQLLVL